MTRKEKWAIRHQLYERCEGACERCGRYIIEEAGEWSSMHAAHVISKARGGPFTMENLQALCLQCHLVNAHNPKSVPKKETIH